MPISGFGPDYINCLDGPERKRSNQLCRWNAAASAEDRRGKDATRVLKMFRNSAAKSRIYSLSISGSYTGGEAANRSQLTPIERPPTIRGLSWR